VTNTNQFFERIGLVRFSFNEERNLPKKRLQVDVIAKEKQPLND